MNWKKFKKSSEAMTGNSCKNLGVCEVKFGCVNGHPYLEIIPITLRITKDEGLSGILLEIDEKEQSKEAKKNIMELAKNEEDLGKGKKLKEHLEKLIQKARSEVSAIESLEV